MKKIYSLSLIIALIAGLSSCNSADKALNLQTSGTGGSLARFSIANDHMYIADNREMTILNVSDAANPTVAGGFEADARMETVFPYGDLLFMGTPNGMLIYDATNPANPTYVSFYTHILGCDPVVVEGDFAYLTVRTGTPCRNDEFSQLEVINISTPASPLQVYAETVDEPYGLGIENGNLFVCEGDKGLRIYRSYMPDSLVYVRTVDSLNMYDVIPQNNVLLAIGNDGLAQYDYSNPDSIFLLSRIPQ